MPTIYDITTDLNRGALNQLCDRYGSTSGIEGKFIRSGNIIIIAPMIECTPAPEAGMDRLPQHVAIANAALTNERISNQLQSSYSNEALLATEPIAIHDAGHFHYVMDNRLKIAAESLRFGRGDSQSRNKTIQIARANLAEDITVINVDF